MGYEHLSITPETESDEVTESNAENLLPIPSKCEVTLEDEIECDTPANDDCSPVFTTFSYPLFKDNDDLDSSDDESLPNEDVPAEEFKIYSNPLCDEDKINFDKLYPHCFNVESGFVEFLLNRDTFIDFSSKFDFSGELAHIKPEIPKSNFDFEEEIRLIENLLYDNSFPRPPEKLNAEIADTIIESIPLPIPVQDGNTQQEEIDIVSETDDVLPPSIENFADDPEGDIRFLEELFIDDSILSDELSDANFEENPLIPRPPPKPPDVETDAGEEIAVVMIDKDKFDDDYQIFMFDKVFSLLFAESADTIFDPGHFAKDCKKAKVKDYNYYKTKMLLAKKYNDEQVLRVEDQAWMESSSDSYQELSVNMVFKAKIENILSDLKESSSSTEETIVKVSYYTSDSESEYESKTSYSSDKSTNYGLFVDNDDDQETFHDAIESASENFDENHIVSQKYHDESEVDHNDLEEKDHLVNKLIVKFNRKIAKCHKHIKKANKQNTYVENQNKDLQDKNDVLNNQVNTFEDKRIGFENASYFEKAKDLRPTLYDENVIGLGYTPIFLTHSDEALEIEKFKRLRENKIEFAYDYGNLNASYVNEKINLEDGYFQKIINPDFYKIDSPFQQTSSLKPYVPNVILENIIIDLEDEVVNLLEKEKVNLETIESLKSKSFESSETVSSESENQSENDCHVVEKQCG
nr:hypothetical protein [Tanacetum cinerariifolium]